MFELCHTFIGYMGNIYIMILPCIFLYDVYVFTQ